MQSGVLIRFFYLILIDISVTFNAIVLLAHSWACHRLQEISNGVRVI